MATVGIDLGTTNSLVSVWQDDKCTLIPNNLGEYLTPSVVGIDENGEMLVGRTAKERLISHPENTVASFKRFMGTEKTFMLGNRRFTAADLSSMVLRQLKEDAEKYLGGFPAVHAACHNVPEAADLNPAGYCSALPCLSSTCFIPRTDILPLRHIS